MTPFVARRPLERGETSGCHLRGDARSQVSPTENAAGPAPKLCAAERSWPARATTAKGYDELRGPGRERSGSALEPQAGCHLLLALIERQERNFGGLRREKQRIGQMPQIGASKITDPGNTIDFTAERSVRINPCDPVQQLSSGVLDSFTPQCGSELGFEKVRREESIESTEARTESRRGGLPERDPHEYGRIDVGGFQSRPSRKRASAPGFRAIDLRAERRVGGEPTTPFSSSLVSVRRRPE